MHIRQFYFAVLGLILTLAFCPGYSTLYGQAPDSTLSTGAGEILLEEVLIEGSLMADTVENTPKNVSVITATDIEQSPGSALIDILSGQAGLNLTSYSGSDKQSSVDLRGMGATANSNVLLIVDGIRLNAPDLSGADLSAIDPQSIEKIEVIRGSETVIYGDGAVAGVIKIYTKPAGKKPVAKGRIGIGSYRDRNASLNYSGRRSRISWNANLGRRDSDGYRENGFFMKNSGGLNLSWELSKAILLTLNVSSMQDEYGLPGPVSIDDIDSEEKRRKSSNPDDSGNTTDSRLVGGFDWDLGDKGSLRFRRGYRFRENDFLLGYNPSSTISKEDQTTHIEEISRTLQLSWSMPYTMFARKQRLKLGIDHSTSYYVRDSKPQNERQNSNTTSLGVFLVNQWQITEDKQLNLGYRSNSFNGKFRKDAGAFYGTSYYWQNGDLTDKTWDNQSLSFGLLWKYAPETGLFLNAANNFRTPNVDEFAAANDDLKPQQGVSTEVGVRHTSEDGGSFMLTLFQMTARDEIYYGIDSSTGESVNRNYEDTTVRQGIEAEFRYFPSDILYLWGNGTYLSARFQGSDSTIPLVPAVKTSIGGELTLNDRMILGLSGTIVGEQYDGNDVSNDRFAKLAGYSVFNSKLTYEINRDRTARCGVRNMFNELYSTVAYSETYYPMPTRNYYCALDWTF